MTPPPVSVLVLTFNGMPTLHVLLDRLAGQRVDFPFEVVAVDSGSRDGTVELLKRRIDRVIEISPEQFDHGLTRNLGVGQCRGELVVLLVQDALPGSETWLAELTRPLFADERVAGTYARQIARPDASAVTRYYLNGWMVSTCEPRVSYVERAEQFFALPPIDRFRLCVFDNVCSCIRKSVWERYPFQQTPIAEDLAWAKEVLLAGHRLEYVPSAIVVHSHERSARYELERTYLVHQRLCALFGLKTIPTALKLARAVLVMLPIHMRCLARSPADRVRPREVLRTIALAAAFPLGQYLGARSQETGREILRPRGV